MGTVDGAGVTRRPSVALGRLATGYLADLVLVGWQAIRGFCDTPPEYPVTLLLQRATRRHVKQVAVNGRWVVRDGQVHNVERSRYHR